MTRKTTQLSALFVLGSLICATAVFAADGPSVETFKSLLVDTQVALPDPGPGANWSSAGGAIWHVRNAEVHERIVPVEGLALEGTLERRVSFNWNLATNESTAWTSFTSTTQVDTWHGHCRGDLVRGTCRGLGEGGSRMDAVYELKAGGIPAVGPYEVTGTIIDPPAGD